MRVDLKHVTFTIPIRIDTSDRLANINYIIKYLNSNFDTNIMVYESGPSREFISPVGHVQHYYELSKDLFHRTRCLNIMAKKAETPIIVNYDCDVLLPVRQLVNACTRIMDNEADMVYPYDGRFLSITHLMLHKHVTEYNIQNLKNVDLPIMAAESIGGAVCWNRKVFLQGGLENENFVSWGHEDVERLHRFQRLGYRVARVKGPLYHIDHARTADSSSANPKFNDNAVELAKVDKMTLDELKAYIKTWSWLNS